MRTATRIHTPTVTEEKKSDSVFSISSVRNRDRKKKKNSIKKKKLNRKEKEKPTSWNSEMNVQIAKSAEAAAQSIDSSRIVPKLNKQVGQRKIRKQENANASDVMNE